VSSIALAGTVSLTAGEDPFVISSPNLNVSADVSNPDGTVVGSRRRREEREGGGGPPPHDQKRMMLPSVFRKKRTDRQTDRQTDI
jgi:hypothetical protein